MLDLELAPVEVRVPSHDAQSGPERRGPAHLVAHDGAGGPVRRRAHPEVRTERDHLVTVFGGDERWIEVDDAVHVAPPQGGEVEVGPVASVEAQPDRAAGVGHFDLQRLREVGRHWFAGPQILNDVLEHTIDPWIALRVAHRLMAPDGRLVGSVPNVRNLATLSIFSSGANGRTSTPALSTAPICGSSP